EGRTSEGASAKLLQVYHQNTGGIDEINYYGKQTNYSSLATVGFVNTAMLSSFRKLQGAVANETTVAGIKKALTNALGGLIEELEHGEASNVNDTN
ncbi:MAG: hypothetical protein P8J32_04400, partial [bacterium]|nr:hypothetical protein [bacterium]